MIQRLPVSEKLALVHDPSRGEGKTAGMAKGLFLSFGDEVYAGESAGFGLPVWKTARLTFFPSLVAARWLGRSIFEKVYRLDRVVCWELFGIRTPLIFSALLERFTRLYMQQPRHQHLLLKVRDISHKLLRMKSVMLEGRSQGECRVAYETGHRKLVVSVDGRSLRGSGELILLNEVAGLPFSRLRIGRLILDGNNIPAWRPCPFSAVLENPAAGIGFSISPGCRPFPPDWRLAGGREVGRGLNWAGLEMSAEPRFFSYEVRLLVEAHGETGIQEHP
ncbi:MAG TPA: hypothetical protein PK036_00365 [Geobacteraceae bacterium]|nr:hypothetical protein [Geobacteraceae bacterium]